MLATAYLLPRGADNDGSSRVKFDADTPMPFPNDAGQTPLPLAVTEGHAPMVELLVDS